MKAHDDLGAYILSTGKRIRDYMLRAQLETLAKHPDLKRFRDLTTPQMTAAMMALERGPLSLNELSAGLGVSAPSASVMVDKLVEKGVMTRVACPNDRRKVVVAISDDARARLGRVQQSMRVALDELTAELGEAETRRWFNVMKKIRQALDNLERSEGC